MIAQVRRTTAPVMFPVRSLVSLPHVRVGVAGKRVHALEVIVRSDAAQRLLSLPIVPSSVPAAVALLIWMLHLRCVWIAEALG